MKLSVFTATLVLGISATVSAAPLKYNQVSCKIDRTQLTVNVNEKTAKWDGKLMRNLAEIRANNSTLTLTLDNPMAMDIHTVSIRIPRTIKYGEIDNLSITQTNYMDMADMSVYECVISR